MTVPKIVKGNYFDVACDVNGSGTFVTICGLTTRNLTQAAQTSDEYLRDCADPTMVPFRVVNVTGQSFEIAGTGLYNRAQGSLIRDLFGKSLTYRFVMGEDADDAVDSGYYQGQFVLTNNQIGAADGTNVTAQFTWQSDGLVSWVPGAEIIVLDILDVSPKTATEDAAWSGTVTGTTAGSTLTATSSDSTELTVSGTGTTRTVGGTFSTGGSKTITLTETLAAASNSPRVTTLIVAVEAA